MQSGLIRNPVILVEFLAKLSCYPVVLLGWHRPAPRRHVTPHAAPRRNASQRKVPVLQLRLEGGCCA